MCCDQLLFIFPKAQPGDRPKICVLGGFPGGSDGKESAWNVGDSTLNLGVRKIPWRRERLFAPGFLPGEFHGHRCMENFRNPFAQIMLPSAGMQLSFWSSQSLSFLAFHPPIHAPPWVPIKPSAVYSDCLSPMVSRSTAHGWHISTQSCHHPVLAQLLWGHEPQTQLLWNGMFTLFCHIETTVAQRSCDFFRSLRELSGLA